MPLPIGSSSTLSSSSSSAVLHHIQSHRDVPVEQLFTRLDIVGKGAYGAVYKGIHNATGTVLALKVINLDTAEDDIIEIQREVALLSQLRDSDRHNCIGYHGCYFYKTELWIAMDFASGGSIRTLLKPGKIDERYTQLIIRETLIGLSYLHRQEIIHRDIKSANILLTNTNRILLCDFGIAAPLQSTNHKRSTFIGTPYWMAPEVITDGKLYDTKADIWSLGITLYEMLNGNPPFSDLTPAKVILKIPRSQPAKLEGNHFSNGVKEFLAACLIDEPNDRPTAEDLMKHKWIKSISKAPLSPLKDLTIRYSRWINSGGVRQSLADISSPDATARPDSISVDKSDWDFMDDHDSDQADPNGPNGFDGSGMTAEQRELWNNSKDGAATVRPHTNQLIQRQARPHRLMKLFEEESNENSPSMGMFGQFGFQNPFAHSSSANQGPASQSSPLIGLGFSVPGLPDSAMDIATPTISIPSTEELDQLLDTPIIGDQSNPNRPFSPSGFNRSITPTPTSFQRMNQGGLTSSVGVSSHLNKLMIPTEASMMTPPMPNPSGTPDGGSSTSTMANVNHGLGNGGTSAVAVSTSPSLPVVSRKDPGPGLAGSNRNRANTAPPTQDGPPSTSNSPALPPPMTARGNFGGGGGGGKQFGGNGFSFGGASSSMGSQAGANSSLPNTAPATNGGYASYPQATSYAVNSPSSATPTSFHHNISPDRADRERNPKAGGTNAHGYQAGNMRAPAGGSAPSGPSAPGSRTRAMTESTHNHNNNNNNLAKSQASSLASSVTSLAASVSSTSSSATTPTLPSKPMSSHTGPVHLIPNWPTGERMVAKGQKGLHYHQLTNVKDVKVELEHTLNELSRWLETCDVGLGLLIDSMK